MAAATISAVKNRSQTCHVLTTRYTAIPMPISWKTSGHEAGSLGESDHAGRCQRIDLATFDPQLAEDFCRVLTEPRRWPSHAGVDLGAADGKSEHPDAAAPGLLHLGDESEVLDLGVGEDLVELVDRAAGDRRLLESPPTPPSPRGPPWARPAHGTLDAS